MKYLLLVPFVTFLAVNLLRASDTIPDPPHFNSRKKIIMGISPGYQYIPASDRGVYTIDSQYGVNAEVRVNTPKLMAALAFADAFLEEKREWNQNDYGRPTIFYKNVFPNYRIGLGMTTEYLVRTNIKRVAVGADIRVILLPKPALPILRCWVGINITDRLTIKTFVYRDLFSQFGVEARVRYYFL